MYAYEAFRSLIAKPQRTLLALLGIMIGIGAVITLVSIGKIVTAEATREFLALGTDIISVKIDTQEPRQLRSTSLFQTLHERLDCVAVAAPYVLSQTPLPGAEEATQYIIATDQQFQRFSRVKLATGRFVSAWDNQQAYAVLGNRLAKHLAPAQSPSNWLGQHVSGPDQRYQVVGILAPATNMKSASIHPDYGLFIPIANYLQHHRSTYINRALLRISADTSAEQCRDQVLQFLQRRLPEAKLRAHTAEQLISYLKSQKELMSTLLTAIASISLLVGGVGIMNIMLVSVSERRNEIGIRRALGASQTNIRLQFLTESVVLALLGGLSGIGLSFIATWYIALYNDWAFFFSWLPALLGAGISMLIGIIFGLAPAHQAAKMDPIQALRYE